MNSDEVAREYRYVIGKISIEDFESLIDLTNQQLLQRSYEKRMIERGKTLEQRSLEHIEREFYAIYPLIK